MAKVKISDYSTTNSNNTDINSIDINEGCAPSGINNAIREVMVHLKNWQTNASGDGATFASLVVQGTGSFTGAVTMPAGATLSGTNTLSGSTVMAASLGTSASPSIYFTSDTNTGIFSPTADTVGVATGGSERMRVDSSGNVGIGTSSPNTKLQINVGGSGGAVINFDGYNAFGWSDSDHLNIGGITASQWQTLKMYTGGTERARITSSGYFKASNTGSYLSSTGLNHEFNQNGNNKNLVINSSNASLADYINYINAHRAASSAYTFIGCFSGNDADLEFNLRGDGNGYADGTWNNNGADYAEFFESANGQALTLGATVVLDGNKVREATDQDPASAIIGVVRPKEPSKASMVVGNTAWNKWANKYLTDDFDRYIMEDHNVVEWEEQVLEREAVAAVEAVVDEEGNEVSPAVPAQEAAYKTVKHSYESHNIPAGITVPNDATVKTHDDKGNKFQHYKLNPAWDKDAEYVNRENRPEWNIIGLLGQVKILKGQPVGDRWTKMRDVSATVEEWMIR